MFFALESASLARASGSALRQDIRENPDMDPMNRAVSPRALELAQTLVRMNTVSANSQP